MTTRVIFHPEKLYAAGGEKGRSLSGHLNQITVGDLIANLPDGEDPYISVSENILHYCMPDNITQNWIKEISTHDNICKGFSPKRRLGEYLHGTAQAVVKKGDQHYMVSVRGKTLAEVQELYRLICEGQIWPVGDHEAKMVPPPCRHVRELLRELWAVIRRDVSHKLRKVSVQ